MPVSRVFISLEAEKYTPDCCKDMAFPPVFFIKALTPRQLSNIDRIESKTDKEGETTTDVSVMEQNIMACQYAIKSWEIYDHDEDELAKLNEEDRKQYLVEFDRSLIDEKIDPEIIREMGNHLRKRSKTGEEQKK